MSTDSVNEEKKCLVKSGKGRFFRRAKGDFPIKGFVCAIKGFDSPIKSADSPIKAFDWKTNLVEELFSGKRLVFIISKTEW